MAGSTHSSPVVNRLRAAGLYALKVAVLAIAYHYAAELSLKMAFVQMNTSAVWPPTGIALAALLLFGYDLWPGIALGVFAGSVATGAQSGIALGMACGNTFEALAMAFALRRFLHFRNPMDRIQDVVGLALCAVPGTMIGATVGATTLLLAGAGEAARFGTIWLTWWVGDLLGALVVGPALLVWAAPLPRGGRPARYVEGAGLTVLLALVTGYVFSSQPPAGVFHQALIYLIFPFTIWSALRFAQRGATSAILLVSGIAIWGTVQGVGPFSAGTRNDSLILLQTFLAVVSLTSLILAAAGMERRRATAELSQRVEDLAALSDSSKRFLDNPDARALYQTICDLAVSRLKLDAAWMETAACDERGAELVAARGIAPDVAAAVKDARWFDGEGTRPAGAALPGGTTAFRSGGLFPLTFGNERLGTLGLLSRGTAFFTPDRRLLIQSYANLAAVAVQNAWLFDEVRQGNRQLHALSQRLMQAQEEERLQLSRELHDESGQLLAGLMVQLGLLEREAGDALGVHARVDELKRTANAIQDNLHQLAVDLRPASLDHLGLLTAIRQFTSEFSRQHGIPVEFDAVGLDDQRLPIEVETTLFRVVQESLTNVILHARATRVDVLLTRRDGRVVAVVEDNGVGFVPAAPGPQPRLGLFGMSERVEMLGGTFTVESSPGKGTTVLAEVPCHD